MTGGVTELVDRDGLENRCTLAGTVGSNPTPTAMVPRGGKARSSTAREKDRLIGCAER